MKPLVWISMLVGSTIGEFIPSIWGAGVFSFSSLFFGAVGAIIGIYVGFKASN